MFINLLFIKGLAASKRMCFQLLNRPFGSNNRSRRKFDASLKATPTADGFIVAAGGRCGTGRFDLSGAVDAARFRKVFRQREAIVRVIIAHNCSGHLSVVHLSVVHLPVLSRRLTYCDAASRREPDFEVEIPTWIGDRRPSPTALGFAWCWKPGIRSGLAAPWKRRL